MDTNNHLNDFEWHGETIEFPYNKISSNLRPVRFFDFLINLHGLISIRSNLYKNSESLVRFFWQCGEDLFDVSFEDRKFDSKISVEEEYQSLFREVLLKQYDISIDILDVLYHKLNTNEEDEKFKRLIFKVLENLKLYLEEIPKMNVQFDFEKDDLEHILKRLADNISKKYSSILKEETTKNNIDLKQDSEIQDNELDLSFKWIHKGGEKSLRILYEGLMKDKKYISSDTNYNQFKVAFGIAQRDNEPKIKWINKAGRNSTYNKKVLIYLFFELFNIGLVRKEFNIGDKQNKYKSFVPKLHYAFIDGDGKDFNNWPQSIISEFKDPPKMPCPDRNYISELIKRINSNKY